jgi:transposase
MPLHRGDIRFCSTLMATYWPLFTPMLDIKGFTSWSLRHILTYTSVDRDTPLPPPNRKAQHLKQTGGLNRHPERVRAPWFQADGFFDSRDLVQVKYEMLRQVRIEGAEKTEAASLFGVSRPTFYQAEADFARAGLSGLLPKSRGPKGAHKLTPEVMRFIEAQQIEEEPPGARALARLIETELGVSVHPRSIERALARKKKR